MDALVLPSHTTAVWSEQFGRVLIEAMAEHVPVIGSDSGAIPEVIADAGIIFHEGDVGRITQQLQELLSNETRRCMMSGTRTRHVWRQITPIKPLPGKPLTCTGRSSERQCENWH